jgi:hypothetical protein
MRRKNRKWVAMAAVAYLFVMWSAYRWAIAQRIPEGNIFNRIERDGIKRLAEEKTKAEAAAPKPTGESRLTAAGPAYVAARYDASHVVFIVAAETESRFSNSPLINSSGTPTRVPAAPRPAATLAGLQELWEPDSHSFHFFPEIIQKTRPGEQWTLSVSPDSTIPVVIERAVIAPTGCSLALGFLASVPPEQRAAYAASSRDYFAVRRTAVESVVPAVTANISDLPEWKLTPAVARQIEQQLNDRMKQELSKIDARLLANAGSPGETAGQTLGDARPRTKEWIQADRGLLRGEGTLDYDVRAFRLTPDGFPRLFVRARWKLASAPVFLMSAWFRVDSPKDAASPAAQPILLSADSNWSTSLRHGNAGTLGDGLDFQTVLNEFDADHDGWAELLVHSYAVLDGSASTAITLYLYTDLGLVPMKTPLRRDAQSPESCLDP